MTSNAGIETQLVCTCLLCGTAGRVLYEGLTDRLFGAPGVWGFLKCPHCDLVWLNPRPIPSEIHKVYETYFTHGDGRWTFRLPLLREKVKRALYATVPGHEGISKGWVWKAVGSALSSVPLFRETAALGTMCLNGTSKGKLLDVGCGNGDFLALMRDAGWEVTGIEPSLAAAHYARRSHGIVVIDGALEDARFCDRSFAAVTLSHVIEHVHDPIALLRECGRILRPGGKIVVHTPNLSSCGHDAFGCSWAALDPPRHLYLFTTETLHACCERAGLSVEMLRTSERIAPWVWAASKVIAEKGAFHRASDFSLSLRVDGLAFQVREHRARKTNDKAGEELVLICGHPRAADFNASVNEPVNLQAPGVA